MDCDQRPPSRLGTTWLLEDALRRLGPEQRSSVVETYLRGRPYAEVAEEQSVPVGTLRSRVFYGLKNRLREQLGAYALGQLVDGERAVLDDLDESHDPPVPAPDHFPAILRRINAERAERAGLGGAHRRTPAPSIAVRVRTPRQVRQDRAPVAARSSRSGRGPDLRCGPGCSSRPRDS